MLQAGEVDGPFRLGWLWDLPSAENFLTPLFRSDSDDNYTGYNNPEFDAAIDEFKGAPTEEEGYPALKTAQDQLATDMPVAPMFFNKEQKVVSERVANVNHTVFGFTEVESIEPAG